MTKKFRTSTIKHQTFFLACYFLFFLFPLHAQFYQLKNYNVKDGLPSSEVYAMMQDKAGYLWFTTDMGVSRFNGYEFKNFSTENGLADNTNFGLNQDTKGRIWFYSFSGKLSYFENESMHVIPCNGKLGIMLEKTRLTSLFVDSGDTIWAGTTRDSIVKITPGWKDADVKLIPLSSQGGYLVFLEKDGFIFGGNSPDVFDITVFNSQFEKKYVLPAHVLRGGIKDIRYAVFRLRDGTFAAGISNVILRFKDGQVLSRTETKSIIICMTEDANQHVLVGSYDAADEYSDYSFSKKTPISNLTHKIITSVCIDHENGLWFCTEGNGIFYIPFLNFTYYIPSDGFSESKISCVGNYGGQALCGHLDGTVTLLNQNTVKSIRINTDTLASSNLNRASGIVFQDSVTAYIGLIRNIYKLDIPTFKTNVVSTKGTKKLIKSTNNKIWSIQFRRLVRFSPAENFRREFSPELLYYSDNIYEDHTGKLWISQVKGVSTYDSVAGIVSHEKDNPLLESRIVDVQEAADGSIWMVSRGNGVIVKRGNDYFNITQKNGLAGNMCRTIFVDSGNVVWVGTNNGLSKILLVPGKDFNYSIVNYTSKNGLLTNEVNNILRQGNKLWLVHNNGVSIFNPENIGNNTSAPPVYITAIIVNDDTVNNPQANSFRHDQNYFNISFIGLSYKDPGHIEYRYKMEGIDSAWIYTSYTSVKYQTLPPGDYRFVVFAKNNDGNRSKTPAVFAFTILPAWWQTWWFKIIAGIIVLIIIIIIFKKRISVIRSRDQAKAMLQNRIAGIELNALRAQMNPHFLFNSINSVQYFITNNDPDSSQKYLSKFAKLIRYVVDNSKLTSIPVKKEIEALTLYLELEALRFSDRFEYEIKVHPNVDTEYTQIPSMLIQPYVENSIWHGIMHKEGNGKIEISLEMKGDILYCMILDNGIGRQRSMDLKREKETLLHESVGMSNTRERLEIINQVNKSDMSVVVSDVLNEKDEICGTKVEIHIPIS